MCKIAHSHKHDTRYQGSWSKWHQNFTIPQQNAPHSYPTNHHQMCQNQTEDGIIVFHAHPIYIQ